MSRTRSRPRKKDASIRRVTLAVPLFLALAACGGGGNSTAGDSTSAVNGTTECAGAPEPDEIGMNASTLEPTELRAALNLEFLCGQNSPTRQLWPEGITKADALDYLDRACSSNFAMPPVPQEWYAQNGGPSRAIDDFARAIVEKLSEQNTSAFRFC